MKAIFASFAVKSFLLIAKDARKTSNLPPFTVYKLIRGSGVTGTASHESVPYLDVLPADSAYSGKDIEAKLKERGYLPMICEKGRRNYPLTEEQKKMNRLKSRIRSRVEHVFVAM